jgi:amino acid permease
MALIFSAATSMIGTGILVYPLLYKENGLVLS